MKTPKAALPVRTNFLAISSMMMLSSFKILLLMLLCLILLSPVAKCQIEPDTGFAIDADALVLAMAQQADGKVLVGGQFTTIDGKNQKYVARLNTNGTIDDGFSPQLDGMVYSITVQLDGKILIGGNFSTVDASSRKGVVRLKQNGSLDDGFDANADGLVRCVIQQPNGKILLSGNFRNVSGEPRNGFVRLTPDGVLDASFNTTVNPYPIRPMITLLSSGKMIAVVDDGSGSVKRGKLARLNSDGSVDASFAYAQGTGYEILMRPLNMFNN